MQKNFVSDLWHPSLGTLWKAPTVLSVVCTAIFLAEQAVQKTGIGTMTASTLNASFPYELPLAAR